MNNTKDDYSVYKPKVDLGDTLDINVENYDTTSGTFLTVSTQNVNDIDPETILLDKYYIITEKLDGTVLATGPYDKGNIPEELKVCELEEIDVQFSTDAYDLVSHYLF